jgi:hypothetical protein
MELTQEANSLVLNYFWLVSKIMREHQNTLSGERVTSLNIPYEIERLQCLFIESCALRYYAVRKIQKSSGRFSAGIDNVAFSKTEDEFLRYREKQLAGTRYKMSGKSTRVKKDLPQKAVLTEEVKKKIGAYVIEANTKLEMQLYESCDLKTCLKNYKGDTVKRVRIAKPGRVEKRPLAYLLYGTGYCKRLLMQQYTRLSNIKRIPIVLVSVLKDPPLMLLLCL